MPTLADWLLFTHLIRFDAVESILFKANLRRIQDYQHLQVRHGMVSPQVRQSNVIMCTGMDHLCIMRSLPVDAHCRAGWQTCAPYQASRRRSSGSTSWRAAGCRGRT